MTDDEIAAILNTPESLNPQPLAAESFDNLQALKEKLRQQQVDTGPVALPKTAADLLQSLTPDPIYRGIVLPFSVNERTKESYFDPINAGPIGMVKSVVEGLPNAIVQGVTAPGRVAAGEYNDVFQPATSEEDYQNKKDRWNQFIGEGLNTAGLATLGRAPVEAVTAADTIPNTLNAGLTIPASIKNLMTVKNAGQPPSAFDISSVDIHAPPNLKSLETPGDLYKTQLVDEKSVLADLAERAGIPNLQDTINRIDQDTQNTALMRVNEALRSGRLSTPNGQFDVSAMPPEMLFKKYKALPHDQQVDTDQYLKLRDYSDDLRLKIARGINPQQATTDLATVQQTLSQLEQRSPIVMEMAQQYRNITGSVRDFLASGPNAMFGQKGLQKLNQERPNYVPIDITGVNPNDPLLARITDANKMQARVGMDDWFLQARDLKNINGIDNRVDAMEALQDYTRNALQAKMENDARGEFIRQVLASKYGSETMRLKLPDEAGKYNDRTVSVYENGDKKDYLSSKLQRDLLHFDPYIAKAWPFYAGKRLWEVGTTGPLNPPFAIVNMLRDALTGAVLNEQGVPKPGVIGTLSAIPQQVVPKMYRAASEFFGQSTKSLPFLDSAARQQLADAMAQRYARSMYALSNEVGGIDASMMKSNIQSNRGVWREVKRSLADATEPVPGLHTLGHGLHQLMNGWEALFGAIADAPRFAVFNKAVKQGMNPTDAAVVARRIAGDTGRGGRAFMANGQRIDADVLNKAAISAAPLTAGTSVFLRELLPYYNPSLQGLRRLATRLVADPVRTQLNAWKYVGIPGLAAYGWNEMLGPQYNDYAQNHRSDYDTAMNLYVGVPGLPPEKGIEFPLAHEMTPWLSPWLAALHAYKRGDPDIGKVIMHRAGQILKNLSPIGYPQPMTMAMAASNVHAPDSILNPLDDVYQMREDNVGLFPQNVEKLLQATFGTVADTALMSAAAGYQGGPKAFFDELGWQVGRRTPIVNNLIGAKTAVTSFGPKDEEVYRKVKAYRDFAQQWKEMNTDTVADPSRLKKLPEGMTTPEVPLYKVAPNLRATPTNPVFKQFGQLIDSYALSNDQGMDALDARDAVLAKQIKLLKGYTAGRRNEFRDWQKQYANADVDYDVALEELNNKRNTMNSKEFNKALKDLNSGLGEEAKTARLINSMDLDLSKRSDVMRLINKLEMDRYGIVSQEGAVLKRLEDKMTDQLHKAGLLPLTSRFDIERHLSPTVPSDFLQKPSQE